MHHSEPTPNLIVLTHFVADHLFPFVVGQLLCRLEGSLLPSGLRLCMETGAAAEGGGNGSEGGGGRESLAAAAMMDPRSDDVVPCDSRPGMSPDEG